MRTPAQLYKFHSANLARVEDALDQVEIHLRCAVATQDRKSQKALLPLYSLMIGASAETQLMKILHEPKAFTELQKQAIINSRVHLDRWHKLLESAVRNHHGLNEAKAISDATIPATDYFYFRELNQLLDHQLKIVIELRNKMAHGQWEYPFTDNFQDVSSDKMRILRQENLLTLKFKRSILKYLLFIIRDVAVSRLAFHRDFDTQYARMKHAMRNLQTRDYEKYRDSLIRKKQRGRVKELANYRAAVR